MSLIMETISFSSFQTWIQRHVSVRFGGVGGENTYFLQNKCSCSSEQCPCVLILFHSSANKCSVPWGCNFQRLTANSHTTTTSEKWRNKCSQCLHMVAAKQEEGETSAHGQVSQRAVCSVMFILFSRKYEWEQFKFKSSIEKYWTEYWLTANETFFRFTCSSVI